MSTKRAMPLPPGLLRSSLAALVLVVCAGTAGPARAAPASPDIALLDRMTWGIDSASLSAFTAAGSSRFLDDQLRSPPSTLPAAAQAQVDAMRISQEPMAQLVVEMDAQNRAANAIADPDQKKAARDAYNKAMNDLGREAQSRSLLRDLYAPDQLREQMTWFWFNHFNVQAQKRDIRAMVGDYEGPGDPSARDRPFPRPARGDAAPSRDAALPRQ